MSSLWDIVKTIGAGVISATVPGGALIVGAINEMLPDDKKLPPNATGHDVEKVVDTLSPAQKVEIWTKEFEVELTEIRESHSTVRAMLESDAANQHSTRPYIARGAFHVIALSIIICVSLWSYAVAIGATTMIKLIMEGWPFILSVTGPFIALLWAYFGILRKEQAQRFNSLSGKPPGGVADLIKKFIR